MKRILALLVVASLGLPAAAQDPKPANGSTSLLSKLIQAINEGKLPGKSGATEEGFTSNGEKLEWIDVATEDLIKMYLSIDLKDEDLLTLAHYAKRAGLRLEAERILSRYVSGGDRKERQPKVEQVVAAWRGTPVPEGGYAFDYTYGYESAADRANRQVIAKVSNLSSTLASSSDLKALDKAFAEVLALYKEAETDAERRAGIKLEAMISLRAAKEKRLKSIETKARNSGKNLGALQAAKTELNKRRDAALKLIYDTAVYLPESHPDWRKGDKVNGQEKVDQHVLEAHPGSVEELWKKAGGYVARLDPSLQRDVEIVNHINAKYLPEFGEKPPADELKAFHQIVNNLNRVVDLTTFSLNDKERDDYLYNRRVDAYNEALNDPAVTKDIKDHVKVLNDYREMMGRRRLFIDPRLCRATTKHSEACNAANRIWHDGPDGTPQTRAKAEGFPAGVGENVAIGYANPEDIWWRGWYRASDHHRNGLSDRWTCVGYGYVGRVGTQNFSDIPLPKGFPPASPTPPVNGK
jgi:uncharacterized protein YkwD